MAIDAGIGPAGYHAQYYSDRDWRFYLPVLATVIKYSRPGKILDLGAGCGYFVEAANRWGLQATGIDGSAEAISMAKQRHPTLDMRLHRMSAPLPFPAHSIQTVVINQVIEHLEPSVVKIVLGEALRVLQADGMILITSPCRYNKSEKFADPTHINMTSPSDLRKTVAQAGFREATSFDFPLNLLGNSLIGKGLMQAIFKICPADRISATANVIAYK